MNDEPTIDLQAYARRIDFEGQLTPTRETLVQLVERHAATIAFENVDVLAGRVPRLGPAALQHKLVRQRRGGYCYEQNGLFLAVLRQVGFEAHRLEARVRAGVPADVVTARTHLALRVMLDGEAWLADVGFGGLAPTAPLNLASREMQHDSVSGYRLVDVEGGLLLQIDSREGWSDCYRLEPGEPSPIDCEAGNWFVATHPTALLGKNLLVGRCLPGERRRLFNRKLTVWRANAGPPAERVLETRAEMAEVLADAFDLEISAEDFDAVMTAIELADTLYR